MKSVYAVRQVSYSYPSSTSRALQAVDLGFPEHSTTALLGPNGAGKTTLMDVLLGWKRPTCGSVELFGRPLHSYGRAELGTLVSLVPQEEASRFSFTVLDYVLFGRSPHLHQLAMPRPDDVAIALEALQQTGLEQVSTRNVSALSAGERQLVLLSRALAQRPKVLLLDEPTSNLDPGNTSRTVRILKDVAASGLTVVFTTHDPNLAAELADRVVMIKHGSIIHSGTTEEGLQEGLLSELYGTTMLVRRFDGKTFIARG